MVHVQVTVGLPSAGTTYGDHVAGQIANLHMKPTIPHSPHFMIGIKMIGSLEINYPPKMSGVAKTSVVIGGEISRSYHNDSSLTLITDNSVRQKAL